MNKKYVLHIFIVLMTLSLALGVASAEDVSDNADALAVADDAPVADVNAAGGDDTSEEGSLPVADLSVEVDALNETDESTNWTVTVTNHGPESVENALVYIDLTDNLAVTYCAPSAGDYLVEFGVWDVGSIPANEFRQVYIECEKFDEGPYLLNALAIAEDYCARDPFLLDNYDRAFFGSDPGDDYKAAEGGLMPISNLEVDVQAIKQTDDSIYWSVVATNNGPESADTTLVFINYADSLEVTSYEADAGDYLVKYGVWNVGSIAAGESKQLLIETKKIGEGAYYLEALTIAEDSYNTNLGKNYDAEIVEDNSNNTNGNVVSAAEETLPAAGNPIAIALLALLAIGVGGFKRRL